MAFLTGLILLDAPAAALNNAGADDSARTQNAVATKFIRTRRGEMIPYVSAQAFRYWLRTTLAAAESNGWRAAPVFREQKVAYTDANPLEWWDDDLFGYMRAPSKRADAVERRKADPTRANETQTNTEITRVSPFRVSTLLALAPVRMVQDFGTMSRHDGDPVPHEHQFYHAVLKGLVSLDLRAAGTFSDRNRTGYRNLDDVRRAEAEERGLIHLTSESAYRLPTEQRLARVAALLRGLALLAGGAKQAIHYTDVTPRVLILMVSRGGNNPLQYWLGSDSNGEPLVHDAAVAESLRVWGDQMLSPLYVGWVQGFHDDQRDRLTNCLRGVTSGEGGMPLPSDVVVGHPREVLERLVSDLAERADVWLE